MNKVTNLILHIILILWCAVTIVIGIIVATQYEKGNTHNLLYDTGSRETK
jgi:hypothetical protein